jgi:hypothetical protein
MKIFQRLLEKFCKKAKDKMREEYLKSVFLFGRFWLGRITKHRVH